MKGATVEPTEPESVPIDFFLSMPPLGEEEKVMIVEDVDMCMSVSQVDPAPKADPDSWMGSWSSSKSGKKSKSSKKSKKNSKKK